VLWAWVPSQEWTSVRRCRYSLTYCEVPLIPDF
jgi:hypothetical protein